MRFCFLFPSGIPNFVPACTVRGNRRFVYYFTTKQEFGNARLPFLSSGTALSSFCAVAKTWKPLKNHVCVLIGSLV